ncbi:MAG: GIY-YIG nuclease family protein [Candidatus Heimdallarchaeota archaeon]|nr:GIY-YIG nuclease family protein [Candidatus Heimdallarchaeota archaeon]
MKGTYLLYIQVSEILLITIKERKIPIEEGYYLYVGSAYGSGGLASRLHRHLRKKKKNHWHIDKITTSTKTSINGILVLAEQKVECTLSKILSGIENVIAIKEFGNSDCKKNCMSHFFRVS